MEKEAMRNKIEKYLDAIHAKYESISIGNRAVIITFTGPLWLDELDKMIELKLNAFSVNAIDYHKIEVCFEIL